MQIDSYRVIEEIAESNHALLYRIKSSDDLQMVLKIARKGEDEQNALIAREYKILSEFKHPNIAKVNTCGLTKSGRAYFTMEYVPGVAINDHFKGFSEEFVLAILQIMQGLSIFHQKGFVHGDLKPENILYSPEKKKAILIDFGFAGLPSETKQLGGTIGYMAPEVIKSTSIDQRSDLFSLGVVMYEILSGDEFFEFKPIEKIPHQINDLLRRLLSYEPSLRPTINSICLVLNEFTSSHPIELVDYKASLPTTAYIPVSQDLSTLVDEQHQNLLSIAAERGLGKTRTLQELKFNFLQKNYTVFMHNGGSKHTLLQALFEFFGRRIPSVLKDPLNQFQVFEKTLRLIKTSSRKRPVAILIDDFDALSPFEQDLVRYMAFSVLDANILLITTSESSPPFGSIDHQALHLRPFRQEEVSLLLERTFFEIAFAGKNKKAGLHEFSKWLLDESGGNPLFITEILNILFREEAIRYYSHCWQVNLNLLRDIPIPGRILNIVTDKLGGLSNNQRTLFEYLSLLDHPIDRVLINGIIDIADEKDIEKLKQIGLVRELRTNGICTLAIQNRLAARVSKNNIHQDKEETWRRKTVELLESSPSRRKDYLKLQSELLFLENDYANCLKCLLKLAKDAFAICDYRSALHYYKSMLKCNKYLRQKENPEIITKIAYCYQLLGNYDMAISYYRSALETENIEFMAEICSGIAGSQAALGKYSEAAEFFRKAMTYSSNKELQDHIKIAVYSLLCMPQSIEMSIYFNPTFPTAYNAPEVKMLTETMYYQALYEWIRGRNDDGIQKAKDALKLAKKGKLEIHQAYIATLISFFKHQKGDIDAALKDTILAKGIFEKNHLNSMLPLILNMQALLRIDNGQFQKAEELLRNAHSLARQINSTEAIHIISRTMGRLNEYMGNFDAAIALYDEAKNIHPNDPLINYLLSITLFKKGALNKAKNVLETRADDRDHISHLFAKALVAQSMGNEAEGEAAMNEALARIHSETHNLLLKRDFFLCAAHFFYLRGNSKRSLSFARESQGLSSAKSREFLVSSGLIAVNRFLLDQSDLRILSEIKEQLNRIGCYYDCLLLSRMEVDALLESRIEGKGAKHLVSEFQSIQYVQERLGIARDDTWFSSVQTRLFPFLAKRYLQEAFSSEYFETLSEIADLISSGLGSESFIETALDLIMRVTKAQRGAFFMSTKRGMKLLAGREIDQTTIQDAKELSKTAIKEVEKNRIIHTPCALDDAKYSKKKSVMMHKIKSLLCMPLSIHNRVVGAIYLDSRTRKHIFSEKDKEFLITVAKILASVIEKSMEFRSLSEENVLLKSSITEKIGKGFITGSSRQMKKVYHLIESVAGTSSPVLMLGETGTGKGMLARLIHLKSKREKRRFLTINCGTIPENLLESELFGHKRGSFTGAVSDKIGLLEASEYGTVFLDEISNTSPGFQAKLLEAIEEKRIRRIGETKTRTIDIRFIFASNRDLEREVAEARFRQDLFYRINVFTISIPPLRERKKDIPILADFFLDRYRNEMNKDIQGFDASALQYIKTYEWPGNVRELQNAIERAVVLSKSKAISIHDLGLKATGVKTPLPLRETKKMAIKEALQYNNWKIEKTARQLEISRSTLWRYIKELKIERDE